MDDLIGKRVAGFHFDEVEYGIGFVPEMGAHIGEEGEIMDVDYEDGVVKIGFNGGFTYYYPIELAEKYLITEEVEATEDNKGVETKDMEELYASGGVPDGVKNNSKKLPMSKLKVQFPNALQAVVLCSSMGHEKYKDTDEDWLNFLRVPGGSETYRDAFERHSLHKVGYLDEESGLPHLFHELWNKMAEVEIWMRENYKEINI